MKTYSPNQCAASSSGGGGDLPPGGTVNELLTKLSSADGDATWKPLDQQPSFIALEARVTVNETNISQNTTDIGTNAGDISDLETNKENKSEKGQADGYAPLGPDSLVPPAYLPPASAATFTGLTDTPANYTGEANKFVSVKADETGLEFTPGGGGGGLPPGGVTDDLLTKNSGVDGDASFKPLSDQPDFVSLDGRVTVNEGNISTNTTNIGTNASDILDLQTNKENKSEKGVADGYAPLGPDSLVPPQYLPSSGGSEIPANRTVFVDSVYGDDTAAPTRGDVNNPYATIKAAADYVATQTPASNDDWAIRVQPGLYLEDPITIPDYTGIFGIDTLKAKVAPTTDSQPLFTMGIFGNIESLNLSGQINNTGTNLQQALILYPFGAASTAFNLLLSNALLGVDISAGFLSAVDVAFVNVNIGQLGSVQTGIRVRNSSINGNGLFISGDATVGHTGLDLDGVVAFMSHGQINTVDTAIKCFNTRLNIGDFQFIAVPHGVLVDNGSSVEMDNIAASANPMGNPAPSASIGVSVANTNASVPETTVKLTGCSFARYEIANQAKDDSTLVLSDVHYTDGELAIDALDSCTMTWIGGGFRPRNVPDSIGTMGIKVQGSSIVKVSSVYVTLCDVFIECSGTSQVFATDLDATILDRITGRAIAASGSSIVNFRTSKIFSQETLNENKAIEMLDSSRIEVWSSSFQSFRTAIEASGTTICIIKSSSTLIGTGTLANTVGIIANESARILATAITASCETGLIAQDSSDVTVRTSLFAGSSVEFIQLGSATVAFAQTEINEDNIQVSDWSKVFGNFNSTKVDDEALTVLNQLKVGVPESGRKSSMGQGAAYTRGMLVFEYDINTDLFVDVTDAAKESGPPDVGIPNEDSGSGIYIGTELIDGDTGIPVDFAGWFGQLSQTYIPGEGSLDFQVWDGITWQDIDGMVSQANSPYGYLRFAEGEAGKDYNTRLSDILTKIWVRNDPIVPPLGKDLYWVRLLVSDDWYSANWEYRIKLTVAAADVDTNSHEDMPLQIRLSNITDPLFWNNIQNNGEDIRITDGTGRNLIPQEIVWIDTVGEDGEIYFNSVDLSNVDDNDFFIYWGNPIADPVPPIANNGQYNVWLRYDAVYHFQTGPQIWVDSTVGSYDATNRDPTALSLHTPGIFGNDVETPGNSTSGAVMPDLTIFKQPGANWSWEVYCQVDVVESGRIVSLGNNQAQTQRHDYFGMMFDSALLSDFSINGIRYVGLNQDPVPQGVPHQFALQYEAPVGRHFYDGVFNGTINDGETEIETNSLTAPCIGNRGSNFGAFWFPNPGSIDEFRVTREAFLPGWYETTYKNMLDQTNFFTFGPVETEQSASLSGGIPIIQPPRWDQLKLYPNCLIVNKDGFLEYFGTARTIIASGSTFGSFVATTGDDAAAPGDDIWLGPDFGVSTKIRLPALVETRVSTISIEANNIDTSCVGRLRVHFINRNSDSAGAVLFKFVAYESQAGTKYGTTQENSGLNPENTAESFVVATVEAGTQDEEQFVNAEFLFPDRSSEVPFSQKGNLFFYTVERIGTSNLDTYAGDVDVVSIRAYHTKWREGSHTSLF